MRPALRLGTVAVAALVAALVIALPRPQAPEPALAQVVKARVQRALAGLETLRARAVYRSRSGVNDELTTQRLRFATTARGNFRLTDLDDPGDLAYDAATGIERAVTTSASMGIGRFYTVRRGIAPGPPDLGPSDGILNRRLGAAVRRCSRRAPGHPGDDTRGSRRVADRPACRAGRDRRRHRPHRRYRRPCNGHPGEGRDHARRPTSTTSCAWSACGSTTGCRAARSMSGCRAVRR